MDLGFEKSGVNITAAYDNDEAAVTSYNRNLKHSAIQREISDATTLPSNLDIICATPPCQGFSTAGGYKTEDPRNNLLITSCRLIVNSQPKVAVIENVAALTNKRNIPILQHCIELLKSAGYHVKLQILNCEDYGVPQRRKRAFIFARSGGREFNTDMLIENSSKSKLHDVLMGLEGLTNAHTPKFLEEGSKHFLIAQAIKPGQKLCNVRAGQTAVPTWMIPEVFGHTTRSERQFLSAVRSLRRRNRKRSYGDADPISLAEINTELSSDAGNLVSILTKKGYLRRVGNLFDLTNTFNGKYRRLNMYENSPTVDTRFGDFQLFLHPTQHRGMTVREAARIQGFPDSFLFSEKPNTSFRLIGNAVPPPVAAKVANFAKSLV